MNFDQNQLEEKTFWDAYLSGKTETDTSIWHNPITFIKHVWRNVVDGKYFNVEMWENFFKRKELDEINKGYLKYFLRQNKVNNLRIARWNCTSLSILMIFVVLARIYGVHSSKDQGIFDVGLENLVFSTIWLFIAFLYYGYLRLLVEKPEFMNVLSDYLLAKDAYTLWRGIGQCVLTSKFFIICMNVMRELALESSSKSETAEFCYNSYIFNQPYRRSQFSFYQNNVDLYQYLFFASLPYPFTFHISLGVMMFLESFLRIYGCTYDNETGLGATNIPMQEPNAMKQYGFLITMLFYFPVVLLVVAFPLHRSMKVAYLASRYHVRTALGRKRANEQRFREFKYIVQKQLLLLHDVKSLFRYIISKQRFQELLPASEQQENSVYQTIQTRLRQYKASLLQASSCCSTDLDDLMFLMTVQEERFQWKFSDKILLSSLIQQVCNSLYYTIQGHLKKKAKVQALVKCYDLFTTNIIFKSHRSCCSVLLGYSLLIILNILLVNPDIDDMITNQTNTYEEYFRSMPLIFLHTSIIQKDAYCLSIYPQESVKLLQVEITISPSYQSIFAEGLAQQFVQKVIESACNTCYKLVSLYPGGVFQLTKEKIIFVIIGEFPKEYFRLDGLNGSDDMNDESELLEDHDVIMPENIPEHIAQVQFENNKMTKNISNSNIEGMKRISSPTASNRKLACTSNDGSVQSSSSSSSTSGNTSLTPLKRSKRPRSSNKMNKNNSMNSSQNIPLKLINSSYDENDAIGDDDIPSLRSPTSLGLDDIDEIESDEMESSMNSRGRRRAVDGDSAEEHHPFETMMVKEVCVFIDNPNLESFIFDMIYRLPSGHSVAVYRQITAAVLRAHSIFFVQSVEACLQLKERRKRQGTLIILCSERLNYLQSTEEGVFDYGVTMPCSDDELINLVEWLSEKLQQKNEMVRQKKTNKSSRNMSKKMKEVDSVNSDSKEVDSQDHLNRDLISKRTMSDPPTMDRKMEPEQQVKPSASTTDEGDSLQNLTNISKIIDTMLRERQKQKLELESPWTTMITNGTQQFFSQFLHRRNRKSSPENSTLSPKQEERDHRALRSSTTSTSVGSRGAAVDRPVTKSIADKKLKTTETDTKQIPQIVKQKPTNHPDAEPIHESIVDHFVSHLFWSYGLTYKYSAYFLEQYMKWRFYIPASQPYHHTFLPCGILFVYSILYIILIATNHNPFPYNLGILLFYLLIPIRSRLYTMSVAKYNVTFRTGIYFCFAFIGVIIGICSFIDMIDVAKYHNNKNGTMNFITAVIPYLADNCDKYTNLETYGNETSPMLAEVARTVTGEPIRLVDITVYFQEYMNREENVIFFNMIITTIGVAEFIPWPFSSICIVLSFLRYLLYDQMLLSWHIFGQLFLRGSFFTLMLLLIFFLKEQASRQEFLMVYKSILAKALLDRSLFYIVTNLKTYMAEFTALQQDIQDIISYSVLEQSLQIRHSSSLLTILHSIQANDWLVKRFNFKLKLSSRFKFLQTNQRQDILSCMKVYFLRELIYPVASSFLSVGNKEMDAYVVEDNRSDSLPPIKIFLRLYPALTMVRIDPDYFTAVLHFALQNATDRIMQTLQNGGENNLAHEILIWIQPMQLNLNRKGEMSSETSNDHGDTNGGTSMTQSISDIKMLKVSVLDSGDAKYIPKTKGVVRITEISENTDVDHDPLIFNIDLEDDFILDQFMDYFHCPVKYTTSAIAHHTMYKSYQCVVVPYMLAPDSFTMAKYRMTESNDVDRTATMLRTVQPTSNIEAIYRLGDRYYHQYAAAYEQYLSHVHTIKTANATVLMNEENAIHDLSINPASELPDSSTAVIQPIPSFHNPWPDGRVIVLGNFGGELNRQTHKIQAWFDEYGWRVQSYFRSYPQLPYHIFNTVDCIIIEYDIYNLNVTYDIRALIHYFHALEYTGILIVTYHPRIDVHNDMMMKKLLYPNNYVDGTSPDGMIALPLTAEKIQQIIQLSYQKKFTCMITNQIIS